MTETEIRNDYFGRRWFNRDWLLSRSGFGVVTARQRSDHWFEVKVILEKEPPRTGGFEILAAITRAFSFMVGRQVFLRGYEDLMSDSETRHLVTPNREPTRNSLPQPLGSSDSYLGNGENYLGQAIDFFMTEPGEQVAGHLSLCWDTADNLFSTRLAMVSICVEGLLRLAAQPFGGGDPGYTPADRTAFEEWLIAHEACLTPRFISRLRGFLSGLDQRRPVDILWDWQKNGKLGLTPDDIQAWTRTRHPATHAGLVELGRDHDTLQTQVSQFYRVANLMNRIVLHLMGYHGPYVDYAHPGGAELPFPGAQSEGFGCEQVGDADA